MTLVFTRGPAADKLDCGGACCIAATVGWMELDGSSPDMPSHICAGYVYKRADRIVGWAVYISDPIGGRKKK